MNQLIDGCHPTFKKKLNETIQRRKEKKQQTNATGLLYEHRWLVYRRCKAGQGYFAERYKRGMHRTSQSTQIEIDSLSNTH